MSNIAIRVENLSKKYRIGVAKRRYGTLRDSVSDGIRSLFRRNGGSKASETIWALKDVSFEVQRGEVIGVIGRNGAGKSTLLKILTRITEPVSGRAEIHGRVGSLLEVGTGFHPELTGRENVYLNGAILGMRKAEIDRKFDEIVAFSEIEKFIDTPVKHYSSGMSVRLAFAVAAHLEPEVLLVDEVLAVGDVAFQKKCLGKMENVASEGRTILFVSHNMAAVQQLTRRSLLLAGGSLVAEGSTAEVIGRYLDIADNGSRTVYNIDDRSRARTDFLRQVEFVTLKWENNLSNLLQTDEDLLIHITVKANEPVEKFRLSMTIKRIDGTPVGNWFGPETHSLTSGEKGTFRVLLKDLRLAPGKYYCSVAVGTGNYFKKRREFDYVSDVLHFEVVAPGDGIVSEWDRNWGAIRFDQPTITRIA
jgi:lipopolysaccharide transport system ATP-binding protein